MANFNAPMPTYATPFLKEDGRINEPWYRFLFQLQQRTGGSAGGDFVTQGQFDALVSVVDSQDKEINGLYPDAPVLPALPLDAGLVQFLLSPQDLDLGSVQLPVGTVSQQNSDSVAITGGNIDGTAIGATTASSGAFTTITASSTITPSQTAGIVGTTTNNNANAGSIGEFVSNNASSVALTSTVTANITSISLTAGDWDVTGQAVAVAAGSTVLSQFSVGINTTSAVLPQITSGFGASIATGTLGTGTNPALPAMPTRISISTTTTVFLVAAATFTVSTCTANGYIRARRVR